MPDLFSTFGRQGSANSYMWPDMGGTFGFGKGLMGAPPQPQGLPPQAQGIGVPGGPGAPGMGLPQAQGMPGMGAPGAPTSFAPPPVDFSKIGGASGAPDMSALAAPAAAPPVGAPITPPAAGLPQGNPMMMEGQVTGAPGAPADPLTIAGQVSGPGPGGWRAGAMGAISPASYPAMVQQAMGFAKRQY